MKWLSAHRNSSVSLNYPKPENEKSELHSLNYGGENVALKILQELCENEGQVLKFEKLKMPLAKTCPSKLTTLLSPELDFECINIWTFFHRIRDIQSWDVKALSAPPVSLNDQLFGASFSKQWTCKTSLGQNGRESVLFVYWMAITENYRRRGSTWLWQAGKGPIRKFRPIVVKSMRL